ncbi:MAG: helix-turn-helix transcriptional regulator [Alphaproteobacteria bacterium]|nr:helix-turn-helix transcriptional regulator [Alphaproteobacteria bacterium]
MHPKDIGNHLRYYRRIRQLSQQDLAQKAGISRTSLQRLESGEEGTSLHVLLRVCHILECSITLSGPKTPQE